MVRWAAGDRDKNYCRAFLCLPIQPGPTLRHSIMWLKYENEHSGLCSTRPLGEYAVCLPTEA